MTMHGQAHKAISALLATLTAVMLVSGCGSSGGGLIPAASAGPLKDDFEAVAQAARAGNGNCTPTQEAIVKTEQDFIALPSTVDPGLREELNKGIANLRTRAQVLCGQPLSTGVTSTVSSSTTHSTSSSTQSSSPSASTTSSTSTSTTSTPTVTSASTSTATTAPAPGGGVQAPSEAGGPAGNGGQGNGDGGGDGGGGAPPGGNGAGGAGAGGGGGQGGGN